MAIESVNWLPEAHEDVEELQEDRPQVAERVRDTVPEIVKRIQVWGRDPRSHHEWEHLHDEDIPPRYNFYRKWIGEGACRLIVELSDGRMSIVAVLPKDDDTYDDLGKLAERMQRDEESRDDS